MTIAEDFIADTRGKSVDEIDEIEHEYMEDGLFDGNSGLYDPLLIDTAPVTLQNGDLSFNFNGKTLDDVLNHDISFDIAHKVWEYLVDDSGLDTIPGSYRGGDGSGELGAWTDWDESLDGTSGSFDISVPFSIAQKIIDNLAPGTVVREDEQVGWSITFVYTVVDELDTSNWTFADGSTCDWDDLR